MLLGEDLGRRHQRALDAAFRRRAAARGRRRPSCPSPTSPWRRRAIARPDSRSDAISRTARFCAAGQRERQGSCARARAARRSPTSTMPRRARRRARFSSIPAASTSSSSRASSRRAASRRLDDAGKWTSSSACAELPAGSPAGRVEGRREAVERPAHEGPPQPRTRRRRRGGRSRRSGPNGPDPPPRRRRRTRSRGSRSASPRAPRPTGAPKRAARDALERLHEGGIAVVPDDADRAASRRRPTASTRSIPRRMRDGRARPGTGRGSSPAAPLERRDGGDSAAGPRSGTAATRRKSPTVRKPVGRQPLGPRRLRHRESGRRDRARRRRAAEGAGGAIVG